MVFGNNRLRPILHGQCFVPRHLKTHVANSNGIITMYGNTINKHLCMVANVTSYFSYMHLYLSLGKLCRKYEGYLKVYTWV